MKKPNSTHVRVSSEAEISDLRNLIACYQIADDHDREAVWIALRKYLDAAEATGNVY